jgi:hypothetical protein
MRSTIPSPPTPHSLSYDELRAVAPILKGNGSAGLAWWRIRDQGLRDHPQAAELRDNFRQQTLRDRLMERHLAEIIPFFRKRGIEPVLGKGWAVGRLYPGVGLRPYGDLDLLVLPKESAKALEALSNPARPVAPVEIHTEFHQLADRTPEELFRRSRLEVLGEMEIRVLGHEDHFRLLALHGLTHGYWRPAWLCDLAVFLEEVTPDSDAFDWSLCMEGDHWRNEGVRCALGLVQALLGVDLEAAGVPAPWREPPLPGWLVPSALRAWGAPKHYLHKRAPVELLGRPRELFDTARLKWTNAMEVTWRREAPWDDSPRLPHQVMDYLARGVGFLGQAVFSVLRGKSKIPRDHQED